MILTQHFFYVYIHHYTTKIHAGTQLVGGVRGGRQLRPTARHVGMLAEATRYMKGTDTAEQHWWSTSDLKTTDVE